MTTGIWILGDQLHPQQTALATHWHNRHRVSVIFIESLEYAQQRPYHQQKLIFIWSAMRHFAAELRQQGWSVSYFPAAACFFDPLSHWIEENQISELWMMAPSDRSFAEAIYQFSLPCKIIFTENNNFLWSREEFTQWQKGRKRWLMEDFYRQGRRKFQILMASDRPVGGTWNLDKENRRPPKKGESLQTPTPLKFIPDEITQSVIEQVKHLPFPTYGWAEPFGWGVTREQALQVRDRFVREILPTFGPYQDAMVTGEPTMWHSLLSVYLNIGLLQPLEVIRAAEEAYYERDLPLNSVEGFIRQILGWREYMQGIYQTWNRDFATMNWFQHTHPLPDFFWDSQKTEMNCLREVLQQVEKMGYAHHIQRLMVLANFALIAGCSPQEVKNWFHAAFIDAYDWVMQTNVMGMGLFADGGAIASKPYAASANYINKMSDYCRGCQYNPKKRIGEDACPFNYLYWNFLERHQEKLRSLHRMGMVLKNLHRMSESERVAIRQQAAEFLS
jgi:deoxyribodipyrimidine photolyase-related protein